MRPVWNVQNLAALHDVAGFSRLASSLQLLPRGSRSGSRCQHLRRSVAPWTLHALSSDSFS